MNRVNWMAGGLLLLSAGAWAIEPGPSSKPQQGTEQWLQLQSSQRAASRTPQAATATERELAMQRWLESYQHKIPDFFDQAKSGGKISQ
ncbi:DUF3613 domain-containing protein [Pseudomonas abieticivorans]|uniref:DUF3613 domain-containing protein n=1 Tax=Pseudomonas abieticivorans TaxID=2931382 RepID=UPI0020C039BE|nr:DUF3613 domain-containing protein [Pseudomonas sp. PIA16]